MSSSTTVICNYDFNSFEMLRVKVQYLTYIKLQNILIISMTNVTIILNPCNSFGISVVPWFV